MIDAKKTLADWRAEISAELDQARKDLATAEEEHTAAAAAASVAVAAHREMQETLRGITDRPAGLASLPLSRPLALRLDEHKRDASSANSLKASTHGAREAVLRKISELEQAIGQIDQLDSPTDEEAA